MVTQEQRNEAHTNLLQALAAYREVLEEDLKSQYDGSPRWSEEDEEFLVGSIDEIQNLMGADIEYT